LDGKITLLLTLGCGCADLGHAGRGTGCAEGATEISPGLERSDYPGKTSNKHSTL